MGDHGGDGGRLVRGIDVGTERFMLPVGTVTLVLADIEGSTRLWQEHSADMAGEMAELDAIIDETVGRHEGVRPVQQGEGDSFVAAFARPSQAVAAALEIQRRLLGGPIRLRMGVHTGEVQLRDEGNYIGTTINQAGRLRDLAHGGQTLVSHATYELVAERLPDDAVLRDLGRHRLRDLREAQRVWQLCHPELPAEFPALRSLDHLPNNLPVQLTSFVGREAELTVLEKVMAENRLVTLTGSGGCGKTRLALEVAARILDRFPDGVWLVELAPVRDGNLVAQTISTVLNIGPATGEAEVDALVRHLAEQHALLVLDNCEHLVADTAVLVETLLTRCPRLAILATSREPLSVPGEASWRVPSLTVPDATNEPIETLTAFEAVALFIDRARRSRPNFVVTNETAPAVAEICARLDGIPLAIELAAARTRLLTPQQIRDGLTDRFRLLTGGARTLTPRQQTLRASVDWSYQLLSDPERALLERLSVFSGTFSLNSAEAVATGDGIEAMEVLDLVAGLVDKSLVVVSDEGDEPRYRLLETIQQYASDRLTEAGTAGDWRRRHCDHFAEVAYQWGIVDQSGSPANRAKLRREISNLRAAIDWAMDHDPALAVALVTSSTYLWWDLGKVLEGQRRIALALAAAAEESAEVLGPGAACQAILAFRAMDVMTAIMAGQRAVSLARESGEDRVLVEGLWVWGFLASFTVPTVAMPLLEEAVEVARRLDSPRYLIGPAQSLGIAAIQDLRLDEGRALLWESIEAAIAITQEKHTASGRFWIAYADLTQGHLQHAFDELLEVAEVAAAGDETNWVVSCLTWAGMLAAHMGRLNEAVAIADRAMEVMAGSPEALRADWEESINAWVHGFVAFMEGRLDEARRLISQVSVPTTRAFVDGALAGIDIAEGHIEDARRRVSPHIEPGSPRLAATMCRLALARVCRLEGKAAEAEDLAHEVLTTIVDAGVGPGCGHLGVPLCLDVLGEVALDLESWAETARLYAAADTARAGVGLVLPVHDVARREAETAVLRSALGEDGYRAAYGEGATLSLDEAVAYARRGRGERKRPSSGWASLTPTEQQVVELVAEGLTNPQIGERLFISPRTVGSHLSRIFTKLDVSTRAELAGQAAARSGR